MTNRWLWPVANAVGVGVVLVVNALANALPLNGQSTGAIVDRDPVRFLPAGWVFGLVWTTIYAGLVLFAVYGFSGDGRRNPLVVRIGPLFALSCAANVTWLFLWHWERFGLSMIVMLVLLGSLIGISGWGLRDVEQRGQPGVFELIAVWATFSVYLSWISVATLANAAVTVDRGRWDAMGVSDVNRATLMVVAAAALALAFVAHGDLPYGLVFIAAAAGIATRQSDAEWLAFASWTAAALVAVATIIRVVRPSASAEPGGRRLLPVG